MSIAPSVTLVPPATEAPRVLFFPHEPPVPCEHDGTFKVPEHHLDTLLALGWMRVDAPPDAP